MVREETSGVGQHDLCSRQSRGVFEAGWEVVSNELRIGRQQLLEHLAPSQHFQEKVHGRAVPFTHGLPIITDLGSAAKATAAG